MVGERRNDPYGESEDSAPELLKPVTLIRFGAMALGGFVLVFGLVLCVTVFGLVRDIVESPDTIATYLDAWTQDTTPSPAPPDSSESPTESSPADTAAESGNTSDDDPAPDAPQDEQTADASEVEGDASGDAKEALEALANRRGETPRQEAAPRPEYEDVFDVLEDIAGFIREGGIGRAVGALLIFLFCGLLVRLALGVAGMGVKILNLVTQLPSK